MFVAWFVVLTLLVCLAGPAHQLDCEPGTQAPRAARPDERRKEVPRPAAPRPRGQQDPPVAPRDLEAQPAAVAQALPLSCVWCLCACLGAEELVRSACVCRACARAGCKQSKALYLLYIYCSAALQVHGTCLHTERHQNCTCRNRTCTHVRRPMDPNTICGFAALTSLTLCDRHRPNRTLSGNLGALQLQLKLAPPAVQTLKNPATFYPPSTVRDMQFSSGFCARAHAPMPEAMPPIRHGLPSPCDPTHGAPDAVWWTFWWISTCSRRAQGQHPGSQRVGEGGRGWPPGGARAPTLGCECAGRERASPVQFARRLLCH